MKKRKRKRTKNGLPSSSMSNGIFAGMAAIQKHSVSFKALLHKAIFPPTCNETEDDGLVSETRSRTYEQSSTLNNIATSFLGGRRGEGTFVRYW